METNTFTEEEAIKITIQHGYNGSEFITAVWKSRGCLTPTRTMDALIQKLETIYHNVKVDGKGKKRKYILTDKKEEMTEREYNYKGTVPTVDDEIMKEYIFKHLVEKGARFPKSYNKWGEEFKLFRPSTSSNTRDELVNEMKKMHSGQFFNPNEIVSEFINAIRNHNYGIVHNSFNQLEKEGRISQSSVYIFKTVEGSHEEVSKQEYEYALAFKKDIVESLGIDYKHYMLSYRSFHKNAYMIGIIKEIDDRMAEKFKIDYMYVMIKVSIEEKQISKEISREEFDQAYFQKFIKLSKDRQNRNDYQNTKSFWRKNYLMNTLKLLSLVLNDTIKVEGLEQLLCKEILQKEIRRKSDEEFWDYSEESDGEFESNPFI